MSFLVSSFVEGTLPPRLILPPVQIAASATASPATALSANPADSNNRGIMEGRVAVVLDLLLRTLRLAASSTQSQTATATATTTQQQDLRVNNIVNPNPEDSPTLASAKAALAALSVEVFHLRNRLAKVELSYQQLNTNPALAIRDRQRGPQLQKEAKKLTVDLSMKESHIAKNSETIRNLDPEHAEAFISAVKQQTESMVPQSNSMGSFIGGSGVGSMIGGSFSQLLTPSMNSSPIPSHPTSPSPSPSQSIQSPQQSTQNRNLAHISPQTVQVLRRLSILVASAFAAPVDPFGTHFLLHALILIRRFLFPNSSSSTSSIAVSSTGPSQPQPPPPQDPTVILLKQDPVSLYLVALMLVECQLRDGQTSTQIWRKWVRHAINSPSDTTLFDSISANLVQSKRVLVMALDHQILISTKEYDMFLQVFRGCLSAKNSKTFETSAELANRTIVMRSEGYGVHSIHQNPGSLHQQQIQQQQPSPFDRPPFQFRPQIPTSNLRPQSHLPFPSSNTLAPPQPIHQLPQHPPHFNPFLHPTSTSNHQLNPHANPQANPMRLVHSYTPFTHQQQFQHLPQTTSPLSTYRHQQGVPVTPAHLHNRSPLVNVSSATDSLNGAETGSGIYSGIPQVGSPIMDSSILAQGSTGGFILPVPQGMVFGQGNESGFGGTGMKRFMEPEEDEAQVSRKR